MNTIINVNDYKFVMKVKSNYLYVVCQGSDTPGEIMIVNKVLTEPEEKNGDHLQYPRFEGTTLEFLVDTGDVMTQWSYAMKNLSQVPAGHENYDSDEFAFYELGPMSDYPEYFI
jgi:hypothetical protein